MINVLLTEGETSFESLLHHTYEYLAGPIRRRRLTWGEKITKSKKPINIHELECVKLFSTIYPLETDFVKTELMQWMQNSDTIITPSLLAAKFLWLCRTNKIPVMLREISRDFGVRTRNIVQTLSETEYIPPLSALEYINRISRQLNLPDNIRDHASYLVKEDTTIDNTTPMMKACCAVLKAVKAERFHLHKWKVTSALGIQL
jgi:hypothetical protein